MNTTVLIIGVVVVLLLILILVLVGLQRRKSKTVSFEKPAEEEPKELTQQEKSGNYQAQGGFNFAPAKAAEPEPQLLPDQELKATPEPPVIQAAAPAAAQPTPVKETPTEAETPQQPEAGQTRAAMEDTATEPQQESPETAETAPEKKVTAVAAGGAAVAAAGAAAAAVSADAEPQPAEPVASAEPAKSTADSALDTEAEAGDLNIAETAAREDTYHVVEQAEPAVSAGETTVEETVTETEPAPQAADTPESPAVPAAPVVPAVEEAPEEIVEEPATEQAAPEIEAAEAAAPVVVPAVEETPAEIPEQPAVDVEKPEVEAVAAAAAAAVTAEGAEAALEQTPVPSAPAEPAPEPQDEIAPAAGRIGKLRSRLSRSQNVIGQGVLGILTAGDLDEDAWEEIEDTLIMADLGTAVTLRVVESLREKIAERGVSSEAEARTMLRETLIEAARPELDRSIKAMPYEGKPAVVLVVGVNGTGKTTTTGKLARVLVSMGHKVLLGAADTFRAAAADQLETWGSRVGARTIRGAEGADPASVAFDAVAQGIAEQADVVLIDTAGRLHTATGLMDQLGKVKRVVEKKATVDEVLLVLDATVGQNGLIQARTFREVVDITGVVLTKLDGTAKGGIVFQVQEELGVPVKLVGLGEGADHLAPFEVEGFVDALLG
ncbi:signal recognition particle-docking protein FtsY [Corynebacterium sp. A21]|uniref:signal recognition particle-docking protein FtsY n=1 Tax=Corynebacterium sp. A21 TaxID=3457318 RepID=UPI003FD40280